MALGEEGGGRQAAPAGGGGEPLAGLWPALLVALVAAFIAWLWYGNDDGKKKKQQQEEAAAGASPPREAARSETPAGPEPLQRNYECVVSETKPPDVCSPQEPVGNQLGPPGEHRTPNAPKESSETEVKEPTNSFMNYKEYLSGEAFGYPATTSEPPQSQEAAKRGGDTSAVAGVPGVKHEERCKEQLCHNSVDHEEWEIVLEHSAWGDATRKSSADDASSKDLEQAKRVAAVSPMPQTVHVTFRIHYITHSEAQLIAVTGDHECLGQWHHYVPLRCDKDGFWSDSVVLPVDTRVEWKFIVVENGKVRRWEECDNRTLMTEHEDGVAHKWWGYH